MLQNNRNSVSKTLIFVRIMRYNKVDAAIWLLSARGVKKNGQKDFVGGRRTPDSQGIEIQFGAGRLSDHIDPVRQSSGDQSGRERGRDGESQYGVSGLPAGKRGTLGDNHLPRPGTFHGKMDQPAGGLFVGSDVFSDGEMKKSRERDR